MESPKKSRRTQRRVKESDGKIFIFTVSYCKCISSRAEYPYTESFKSGSPVAILVVGLVSARPCLGSRGARGSSVTH